jgi:hypothetical protein
MTGKFRQIRQIQILDKQDCSLADPQFRKSWVNDLLRDKF